MDNPITEKKISSPNRQLVIITSIVNSFKDIQIYPLYMQLNKRVSIGGLHFFILELLRSFLIVFYLI